MAKISLRIYNREIENLIEQSRLDEAIAHCHHILKTFSKHLETYRLLGKAFLEEKHYDEAVDIFNRVLVSVPDDFVSHVGMSIINDDQNKLDHAIWHMERSFESQPSNAAIQGELQRLYGRRDGVEPPKIRMTRGALAHMYVQGELYSQAISEIRAVLQQDPQRADMQVLLAIAYFRGGQKADASDICAQLLKRYPYCLDANRVLVELLPGSDRAESTQVYRLRIYELDPYATFTKGSVFNSGDVADAAVNLERLEYSSQNVSTEQDWSASLGAGLAPADSSDQQPDWLKSGISASSTAVKTQGGHASVSQNQEDIPDFLRAAGWSESSGATEEASSTFDASGAAEEISPAELPDWMKAMAPLQPSQSATPLPPAASSKDSANWLAGLGAMSAAQSVDDSPLGTSAPSDVDVPDWLRGSGNEPQTASQPSSMDETSAWLKNLSDDQSASAQSASSSDMPDWLSGLGGNGQPAPAQSIAPSDLPDWLGSLDADQADKTQKSLFTPEPIKSMAAPVPAATLDMLGASAQEQDDAVSWLESLASKHGAKPEELVTDPNSRSDIAPDWVDQARDIAQTQSPVPVVSQKPAATLDTLGTSAQEQDDAVSWLESLASKHGAKPEELVTDPNSRSDIAPDWVDQAREFAKSQPAPQDEIGAGMREQDNGDAAQDPFTPKQGGQKLVAEDQETSEWLASLAAASPSQPLDWSSPPLGDSKLLWDEPAPAQNKPAESMFEQTQEPMFKETPLNDTPVSADLPDWLRGLDNEPQKPATSAADNIPSWLAAEEESFNSEFQSEPEPKPEPISPSDWHPVEPPIRMIEMPQMEENKKPIFPQPQEQTGTTQAAPESVQPKEVRSTSKPSVRARSATVTPKSTTSALGQAQSELARGDIPSALEHYAKLIKKGRCLDDAIRDLRDALYRYPIEVSIWQALGDAYMRSNRLQEALDAYTKAEELLR
jgi:tetratricopeptide (TPR) repeat protein